MAESQEDWIKRRAYALWESEGYPSGKDRDHWEQAKLEFVTQAPVGDGARTKAPAKAKTTTPAKPPKATPAAAPKKKAPVKASAKTPEKTSNTSEPAKKRSVKKTPAGA